MKKNLYFIINKNDCRNLFSILVFFILSLFTVEVKAQLNPGYELLPPSSNGWSLGGSGWTTGQSTVRTGLNRLNLAAATSGNQAAQHTTYTIAVPSSGTNYVHVIGWYRRTNSSGAVVRTEARGTSTINGVLESDPSGQWNQVTASGLATNGGVYYPSFSAQGNSIAGYSFEDIIIYTSESAFADITAPNSPTSLCVNSSGVNNILTWTNGGDVAGTDFSGIDGVLILRAAAGTALLSQTGNVPTALNNQGYYNLNPDIGPNTIGAWTVLSTTATGGTYTDIAAAGTPYIYAIYMRDKAYNYSAALSFTTANAGTDQNLACGVTSSTMAATAAPAGYTGTWTLSSGTGNFTAINSASSTVNSIATGTSVYQWTVTNGGCTTYDVVNVLAATSVPTAPVISSPANGSSIAAAPVNLFWTNGGGATSYNVYLQQTTNPPTTNYGNQTGTVFGAGSLNAGATYYWRIDAVNVCGTTTGTVWNFNTLPIFSNTTAASCDGWDSGNNFTTFFRDITVSGLPTPLGTASGQYVLNEVEVSLGSSSCTKDLSSYNFRLTDPTGHSIDFFGSGALVSTSNPVWANVKFRDHSSLEMINEYSSTVQSQYYPYSIGYYAVATVDGFLNTFNGFNPNGDWRFAIMENNSDEIRFNSVTLKFGPKIFVNDVSGQSLYDNCAASQCVDLTGVVVATNTSFENGDPIFTSTNPNGSCWYNGANNNSGWFNFTANASTAYITISGMKAISGSGSSDLQPIIVQAPSACVQPTIIPSGGCPEAAINNNDYLPANGGGSSTPYFNGITANAEFNLTGLSVGQKYYLYIDGNGGASGTYYIEGLRGLATNCNLPLPIELIDFNVKCLNGKTFVNWTTASEHNNDFFTIEKSLDLDSWEVAGVIDGAGNSESIINYSFVDDNFNNYNYYYRLKQTDFNGEFKHSEVTFSQCLNENNIVVYPNPSSGVFSINGLIEKERTQINVYNYTGSLVLSDRTINSNYSFDLSNYASGVYFVIVTNLGKQSTFKIIKD